MQELHYSNTQLTCEKKNFSELICCSQECKFYAPVCTQKSCSCRKQNHKYCQLVFTQALNEQIMKKRTKPTPQVEKSIDLIQKIYTDTIDQLSIEKEALLNWRENYGLSADDINLLEIMKEDRRQELTGQFVHLVKSNINQKTSLKLTEKQISRIWRQQRSHLNQLFSKINYAFKPVRYNGKLDNSVVEVNLQCNALQMSLEDVEQKIVNKKVTASQLRTSDQEMNNIREFISMEQPNGYGYQVQSSKSRLKKQ